jgi:hypothetical protein
MPRYVDPITLGDLRRFLERPEIKALPRKTPIVVQCPDLLTATHLNKEAPGISTYAETLLLINWWVEHPSGSGVVPKVDPTPEDETVTVTVIRLH